jgi:hypothetical protein
MMPAARARPNDPPQRGPAPRGRPAARHDSPFAPARFADRGVVLPATTPAFAFARVRDGAQGRELVLRNVTGTRGAMLMPLAAAADHARPTLHDRALFADVLRLPRIGPAQVAAIARAAARSGLSGRSALAAASAAAAAEARAAREMMAALAGGSPAGRHAEAASPAALRLAPLAAAARRLALLPPQLSVLAAMASDRAALAPSARAEDAAFIADAARATARFAEAALGPVLATLDDPAAALAAAATPSWPAEAVGRAAWILDGWPLLLARWEEAEGQGHAAEARALRAIAAALPPLPAELAATAEEQDAVRATWRPEAEAGVNDQALLERLRVAAP